MSNLKRGLVHTVYFWLKEPSDSNRQKLSEGLKSLAEIDLISEAYIGQPAGTSREVVDGSYDFSITFIFEDKATQDAYQTHEDHLIFIDNCGHLWKKVQVYDAFS